MVPAYELLTVALTELAKVKPRDSASNTALSNGKTKVREAKALLTPIPPVPAPTNIRWGAWIDSSVYDSDNDAPWGQDTWDKFEEHAGKKVGIVHYSQPWGQLETAALETVRRRGAVSLISYGSVSLQSVAEGGQDATIESMALKAKNFGGEVIIRPWWEMNGTWYSWGRSPYFDFVAAWRRLYTKIKAIAPNVKFVWCPNTMWDTASDPAPWFPGEMYVDYVGIDGYNAGPLKNTPWHSATTVFGATYTKLRALAPKKDIIICETSSTEQGATAGTSKAAWITDFLGPVLQEQMPAVKAVIWFNQVVEGSGTADWPIESSSAAQSAFKAGIASPYFRAGA
jgi:hypothetical protein